jgi:hypothetical protein
MAETGIEHAGSGVGFHSRHYCYRGLLLRLVLCGGAKRHAQWKNGRDGNRDPYSRIPDFGLGSQKISVKLTAAVLYLHYFVAMVQVRLYSNNPKFGGVNGPDVPGVQRDGSPFMGSLTDCPE